MSIEIVLISIIFTVIAAIVWHEKFSRRAILAAKLKGPPTYPLIGNGHLFFGASPPHILATISNLLKRYGKVVPLFLGFDMMIFVTDPKFIEVLLSSNTLIDKSKEYTFLRDWLGDGLLLTTGKKWQIRRKIITPTFHFKILDQFVEVFEKQGNTFVDILKKIKPDEGVDIYPLVTLYTLDVICESAMGTTANAQLNSNSEYVNAVKDITNVLHLRMFDFMLRPEPFFRLSKSYKRQKKALKVLHDFTDRVIVARRNDLMKKNEEHDENQNGQVGDSGLGIKRKMAFLDVLLQATVDGKPLNNMDIREEVDTFMFEGHDTTTSGISFLLYSIALYPDVQRKVVEEIQDVFGTDTRVPTMSDLSNLQYLDLVIKETMRLYPSVPIIGRRSKKEVTINNVTIPAGAAISVGTYFMGRDPEFFPDPETFNPERFTVERSAEIQNLYSYVPFSAGPRNCIGQKFAVLEMKSIAVKILKNFEISVDENYKHPILMAEIVLRPDNGVHLKFKARQL
uniref:Cytochrome n=1 Tax=Lutzomyia longipalpis TaxID=7200 RepID=A0A1B0EV31_LUTLO